jgi:hypothetical protein
MRTLTLPDESPLHEGPRQTDIERKFPVEAKFSTRAVFSMIQNVKEQLIRPQAAGNYSIFLSMLASGTQIAGSLPAEAVGFFRAKKSSVCLP